MTPRLNETAPFNRVSSCHSQATVITLAFFLAVFITFTGFWVGHWFWKKKRNNVSVDDSVGLIPFQRMEEEVWISLTQWKLRVKGTWTFGMLFGLHVFGFSFSFSNYCFTLPCPTPDTNPCNPKNQCNMLYTCWADFQGCFGFVSRGKARKSKLTP